MSHTTTIKNRTIVAQRDFMTVLAAEEEKASTTVPETHGRLATARANLVRRKNALEAAEDHAANVSASFKKQEETHTALDYAVARAEVARATDMVSGARSELSRAESGLRHDDTRLASLMADVLGHLAPGVPIHPTSLDYREKPANSERPICLVVQTEPTSTSSEGSLSGSVTVRFHFIEALHRGLDERALEQACRERGYLVQAGQVHWRGEGTEELRVTIRSAVGSVPVMPELDPAAGFSALGNRLASEIATSADYGTHPMTRDLRSGLVESSHFAVVPHTARVVSENVDAAKVRITEFEVSVFVRMRIKPDGRTLETVVNDVLGGFRSNPFVPGLGVLDSTPVVVDDSELNVELTEASLALDKATGAPTDANTYIGYYNSADRQVTARFLLRSAIETGEPEGK